MLFQLGEIMYKGHASNDADRSLCSLEFSCSNRCMIIPDGNKLLPALQKGGQLHIIVVSSRNNDISKIMSQVEETRVTVASTTRNSGSSGLKHLWTIGEAPESLAVEGESFFFLLISVASSSVLHFSGVWLCESNMNVTAAAASLGSGAGQQIGAHNVFVYGSLLADDVVRVLLNRVPQSSPAVLHDFHRFSIKGRVYPAILPVEKKSVTGRVGTCSSPSPFPSVSKGFHGFVLMGITNPELDILDTFEDVEYDRRDVEVTLVESSKKLRAAAYVWSNSSDPNLYGEWDFKEWTRKHMEDFIKMTAGFIEELELPDSKTRVTTYETFYQKNGNDSPAS
ncbi:hypothetical protein CDL15_Pgr028889 [Punica granatum]|uniref:Putative gamma-glutamylcyclotransferase n=1 Tax=Punica granatum TaxID=22663 RepID=A0A218WYV3_PUNGR|nr:hypothetical protein CDL15_Pgr028889 [Punica granatum]